MSFRITQIGLLTTLGVSIALFGFGAPYFDPISALYIFILGALCQAAIGLLVDRFQLSYSNALILVFLSLIGLSYLQVPREWFALLSLGLILTYFYSYRQKSPEFVITKDLGPILFAASLFAVTIFVSLSRNIGDPFVHEKLRLFALNPDTLFHASVSTMFKNYDIPANGMHGLNRVHYHLLSHFLYGRFSGLIGLRPIDIYGVGTFVIFAPLLLTGWLRVVWPLVVGNQRSLFWSLLILIGGPFSNVVKWHFNSHFVSESYLIGLIFLSGGVALLVDSIRAHRFTIGQCVSLAALILLTTLSKISVGVILLGISIIAVFCAHQERLIPKIGKILAISAIGAVGYFLSKTIEIPRLEIKWHWGWYQKYVAGNPSFPYFILTHFSPFWVVLVGAALSYKKKSLEHFDRVWFLMTLAATGVGFLAANLTLDSSGYYFSNVHVFLATIFFARFVGILDFDPLNSLERYLRFVPNGFLLLCFIYFSISTVPRSIKDLIDIRKDIQSHVDYQNPFWDKFESVRQDTDPLWMVYIPKEEVRFWENRDIPHPWSSQQCSNLAFYLPVVTGRPALFGLPDTKGSDCYIFFRGFEGYPESAFTASLVANYSNDELCKVVKETSFKGFYRITSTTLDKIPCN